MVITPLRVTHIITDLSTGGAEIMLYKLIKAMDRKSFIPRVISLSRNGEVGEKMASLGIPVRALGMRPASLDLVKFFRLVDWLRQEQPSIIQTWMYHADLYGGLAAWRAGNIPVIWNIRNSTLDKIESKWSTIWTVRACAFLSHLLPAQIVSCSEKAKEVHFDLGYDFDKTVVIPNGFDLEEFQPNSEVRDEVRGELGLPPETPLIGLVARFDPQKDHLSFIEAANVVCENLPFVHFLLCGQGITWQNRELARWIMSFGLEKCFHLLGLRRDIPRLTAALDIAVSSSAYGEGFSNAIGEAMACGIPCVVTDVGDARFIVDETGRIIPAREPQTLGSEIIKLIERPYEERAKIGETARKRVEENFDIRAVAHQYEELYLEVAG